MRQPLILLSALGLILALAACGPAGGEPSQTGGAPLPTESGPVSTKPQSSPPAKETPQPSETDQTQPNLWVDYAPEELLARPEDYDALVLNESEYRVDAAISVKETVTDVQIVSILLEAVGEDDVGFRVETVLGTLNAITPERPFVLSMAFPGSVPNTALLCTGSDGTAQAYTICMSGKDGSLFLSPFVPIGV